MPTLGSPFAAALDLHAAENVLIPSRGRALVDLQLRLEVPTGHYGRIAPRSGLAVKHGIQTGAGAIDADYRGPVRVLLFHHGDADFQVNPKDRIAQLILERIFVPRLPRVETLDETVRGAGGSGSTGGFRPPPKKLKLDNGDIAKGAQQSSLLQLQLRPQKMREAST